MEKDRNHLTRKHATLVLVIGLALALFPQSSLAQTSLALQQVDGAAVKVSAGESNVWVINQSGNIYRRPVDGSGRWEQVAGSLSSIAASAAGWVWGIQSGSSIWKCAKPCAADGSGWQRVDGSAVQVSADDSHVWVVNQGGNIYRRPVNGSGQWEQVGDSFSEVSASGGGWVWGIQSSGSIWRCAKPCAADGSGWLRADGIGVKVSADDSHVWVVDRDGKIYRRPVDGSSSWEQVAGSLSSIAVSNAGWMWGTNSGSQIYKAQLAAAPQPEPSPELTQQQPEPITAQNCSLSDWAGEWDTNFNLLSWQAQSDGSLSGTYNTAKHDIQAKPLASNSCVVEGTYRHRDGISTGRIAFTMNPDKRSFKGAWSAPTVKPTGINWTGTKNTPAVTTTTPPAVTPTPEPPQQVANIIWGTVVFSEPDDSTAPPPEPLPVPEQADPNVIVIAPANVEPYAVLKEDYLASPQSFTPGGNWMGLTPEAFGGVSVQPAVRPVFENDATAAWLSVPGLYGNSNTNEVFRPFVESAFAAMREADWDVRGAGNVDEFILKLKADEDLRADFSPFLVVAAYEGLVSEDVSDPAHARANEYIREVIGGRVVSWQRYINQDIRYQWANWKDRIQDNYVQSFPKYATLSTLVKVPTGCGNFQVEPPAPLVVSGGAAGLNAVKSIFGPAGMIAAAEVASVLETEGGTEWANTPMGRFEANTGIAVENLNEALAARAAMTRIGLGGATVGVLAATTGGIEKYRLDRMKKLTKSLNDGIKARDFDDLAELKKQLQQAAEKEAEQLGKELGEEAQQELVEKTLKEAAEKQAQELAEKGAKEVSEEVIEKALKEGGEELAEEILEVGGKKLSSKIAARLGPKFGSTLGKVLGAGLAVAGVIATFGEILYETLPCEAFESGVLGNLHEVQPDFRAACVTSREYQDGLLYNYCRPGYSGVATNCVKDGCPYGYSESLLYCTPKVTAKDSYGRGVGRSGTCEPGEENIAGLCYSACPSGTTGVGPVCWSNCPAGYNDTGAFCSRGGQVVSQETYTRADQASPMVCSSDQTMEGGLCYQKCQEGYSGVVTDCVQTDCPEGYDNHIATCYRVWPPHNITKKRYARGVGTVPSSCSQGYERKGALCYPNCASGYLSNALNCDKPCPAGYVDDGLTCRMQIETIAKTSSGRELSVPLACSDPAFPSLSGLLCYPECREGYTGNGPVCWEDCPATMVDTGALCQFIPEENPVGFAKESYGRGVGTVPQALGTDVDKDGLLDHLDPHFYDRVDAQIGGISAKARQQLLEETFVHLASYFIAEPAARGKLNIPPTETD